jgi:hypothetical protein
VSSKVLLPWKTYIYLQDSAPLTPIVFVLSTGADPTLYLYNLAREMNFLERLRMISLGQVSHGA